MTINLRKPVEARAEAFISNASHSRPAEEPSKTVVNIRVDSSLLGRVDADARRLGISRTAWLHVAANGMLERAK
jgi:Ribbon-helix-helix protein, copG family